ncbi:Na+/H+ antiporter NhaC family protein [bacterium]|nr:Na+/H+ antiporter NhaC family protein [bacterium]
MSSPSKLTFHGGRFMATLPMLFFIVWAISICVAGAPDEAGLILGMLMGLVLTMFLVKGKWFDFCEEIFTGMADRIGVVAIVCWLFAGMFAQVLKVGGLVEGLVWLGTVLNVSGSFFPAITFLLAAVFATAVGTGYGTTVAFCTLMYPTGIIMGAPPVLMFAAILSGAAFGDNLAPVSDTTIVSAATQETDVPGVVRSRFKYAITAALPALFLFIALGFTMAPESTTTASSGVMANIGPKGLLLLIPFGVVIFLALKGFHIITAITIGMILSILFFPIFNLSSLGTIITIDTQTAQVTGALVEGITGYVKMAVLILLIMAANHIIRVGGAMDAIKDFLFGFIKNSVRRAELVIWAFVSSLNVFITINTAAEIAAAPFVKEIGKKFKLHPYRRANFLDAITSALGYIFPWSGGVLIGFATISHLAKTMPGLAVVKPTDVWPFVFHGWLLVLVMLLAAITGKGRRFEK